MKKKVEEELLFRKEFRWRNNKPVCLKAGDVIEVEFDSSKKYAYVKRENNILEDAKKRAEELFKGLTPEHKEKLRLGRLKAHEGRKKLKLAEKERIEKITKDVKEARTRTPK